MLLDGCVGICRVTQAVRAAIDLPLRLFAVPNDAAAAVRAERCEVVNRALKTVKDMSASGHDHFKGLRIIVTAGFASFFHGKVNACKEYARFAQQLSAH